MRFYLLWKYKGSAKILNVYVLLWNRTYDIMSLLVYYIFVVKTPSTCMVFKFTSILNQFNNSIETIFLTLQ